MLCWGFNSSCFQFKFFSKPDSVDAESLRTVVLQTSRVRAAASRTAAPSSQLGNLLQWAGNWGAARRWGGRPGVVAQRDVPFPAAS